MFSEDAQPHDKIVWGKKSKMVYKEQLGLLR